MTYSPAAAARFKDRQWLLRKQREEACQAEVFRWWLLNHRTLGVDNYRVMWANGTWLGKPKGSAFFILRRLHDLGYDPGSANLTLAVARGGSHGLYLWFRDAESWESADSAQMRQVLASQGYDVAVVTGPTAGLVAITDYLSRAGSGSG